MNACFLKHAQLTLPSRWLTRRLKVSMSQRELTVEGVEDKTEVDKVLEEAEDSVVAPVQPVFHQRNRQQWASKNKPNITSRLHHKKCQAANKASTGTQTSPEKETNLTAQEQPLVDRVPTNVLSVLTTPAAPAPAGSVIRDVLSATAKKKQTKSVTPSDRRVFAREVNNVNFKCQTRNCETMLAVSSLVDGGANGGLTGSDMSRIEMTFAEADVPGVANNDLKDLGVGAFAALGHSRGQSVAGERSQAQLVTPRHPCSWSLF
jgi:hypothetical protein